MGLVPGLGSQESFGFSEAFKGHLGEGLGFGDLRIRGFENLLSCVNLDLLV